MDKFVFTCLLFTSVLSNAQSNNVRVKRQDDKSISDVSVEVSDELRISNETTTETPETTTEENPCLNVLPPMPDFSATGRRISDVKCFEHIWIIKDRENKENQQIACKQYTIRKNRTEGIPAVPNIPAVIGGRNTFLGEFPHMGAIGWKSPLGGWVFKCGGSLISDKFVLTAGHCSKASERDTSIDGVDPKIVRLADKNILSLTPSGISIIHQDVEISRFINHPEYHPPKKYFDIALIELKSKVKFDNLVQPACLYTGSGDSLIGKTAMMTGWGVIETATRKTSPELQAVELDVLSSKQCDDLLAPSCNRHWCGMQETQMCAGKLAGGADACQGDSGGPLQIPISFAQISSLNCESTCRRMHQVIGVTSFGVGCALPNLPGIYSRVSSFLDWIEDTVWK